MISPESTQMEQEKRIRREIANSNERRRMQSINAGFQSLRTLLPSHDGEKLSKAAILQHTADFIYHLEQEKTRLLAQNCQLKRLVSSQSGHDSDASCDNSPLPKRTKTEVKIHNAPESSDSSDEGVALCASPKDRVTIAEGEPSIDDLRREMVELRVQLDRERRLRMSLEEQTRQLESQLYPEKIREIAQSVQMQFQSQKIADLSMNSQESSESVSPDDVIAETIEIETQNCPDSPSPMMSPLVFQTPLTSKSAKSTSVVSIAGHVLTDAQPQDLSSKSITPAKKGTNKVPSQPAAIALPIDVPFITTDSVEGSVTLEIITPGNVSGTYHNVGSTSRQNLDTIVEAIRHLEGDHLFRDDDNAPLIVKKEHDDELIVAEKTSNGSDAILSPALRTVLTMSPEQFGAIRHQVIQLQRPGVIVANHA